jgi:oligopeptide/dipeptide ABC transporter ATP-binding protein
MLRVEDLVVQYKGVKEPTLKGVSLTIEPGERMALVGESGSGKSTLAKALLGLAPVQSGKVSFQGRRVVAPDQKLADQDYRRRVQMIFQDPYNSLHPRLSVQSNLMEPLKIHRLYDPRKSLTACDQVLERVGLDPQVAKRYPRQFSGGQLQRIGIARALLMEPLLLLADEPVSALDVSVQAQVLNLLGRLSADSELAVLFISHDLAVVRHLCERVAVMYQGRLVEVGPVDQVCFEPQHPYTQSLVDATQGKPVDLPPQSEVQGSCPYLPRCSYSQDRCKQELPPLLENTAGHLSACHFPGCSRGTSGDESV